MNGCTTGTAIALMVENQNTRSADYAKTADLLRPGHADYTAYAKLPRVSRMRGAAGTFPAGSPPPSWPAVPSCWVR